MLPFLIILKNFNKGTGFVRIYKGINLFFEKETTSPPAPLRKRGEK
jgi:hypothetical protein